MDDGKPDSARGAVDANRFRLLHTMIRVMDLDKSIDFYTRLLGMRLLWRKDYPSGKFTLAFVGYGDEESGAVIELTHNLGREERYQIGTGFGHLAIGVPDVYGTCKTLEEEGVTFGADDTCDLKQYRWEPENPEDYHFTPGEDMPF